MLAPKEKIRQLSPWYSAFSNIDMDKTALCVVNLQTAIGKSANFEEMRNLYAVLENTAHEEFPNKTNGISGYNSHRDKIFRSISEQVGKAVNGNFNEAKHAIDYSYDIIFTRTKKLQYWNSLLNLILKKDATALQKFLGLNILYLTKVEGYFEENAKICYMWIKLAEKEKVSKEELESIRVGDIKRYFDERNLDLSIFEGWEHHLRNAIAHLSFTFDEKENKMHYEDKNWKISLSFNELLQMNQKLVNVNDMVTALFGLVIIRDTCFAKY